MMETISLMDTRNILCGFYELDARGKVNYARLKHDGKFERADDSVIGRNFFAEIFTCRNVDVLERHFQAFVGDRISTESFIFGGQLGEQLIGFRIMLVRISESRNGNGRREPVFYLDIKPG